MKKIIDFFTKGYDSTLNNIIKAILIAVPIGIFIGWAYPGYYVWWIDAPLWIPKIQVPPYRFKDYTFFREVYKEAAFVASIVFTLILFLFYNTRKK